MTVDEPWPRCDGLRTLALAEAGPVRTWLNELIVNGAKTATAQRLIGEYERAGERLECAGEVLILLDNDAQAVTRLEVTRAEAVEFGKVTAEFIAAEGENFADHAAWAAVHRPFFERLGEPVTHRTAVACVWFRLAG